MNIFGGNTGVTYEQLQQRRKLADQLRAQNTRTPQNVGEGIHAIARALVARGTDRQASARDKELRDEFNSQFEQISPNTQGLVDLANSPYATAAHKDVIEALLKGAPNYRRGTAFHPGGKAVVGEDGPEVVELPYGAAVMPTFGNSTDFGMGLDPADADFLFELPEPVKADAIRRIKGGEPARGVLDQIFQQQQQMQQYDPASQQRMNEGGDLPVVPEIDGRGMLGPESSVQPGRFDDANAVQVAQATLGDVVSDADRPVASEKMTEGQSKDVVYFRRGSAANSELNKLEDAVTQWGDNFAGNFGAIGRLFQDADYQKGMRAANEFLAMVLRKDTGAAVTKQEFELYGPMYIPMPGDKPETIEAKRQAREQFLISLYDASGPRTRDVQRNAAQETTKSVDDMSDEEFMQWLQTQGGN